MYFYGEAPNWSFLLLGRLVESATVYVKFLPFRLSFHNSIFYQYHSPEWFSLVSQNMGQIMLISHHKIQFQHFEGGQLFQSQFMCRIELLNFSMHGN